MGIDIEKVQVDKCRVMECQMTLREKNMIKEVSFSYDRLLTLLWTVKEALSKILRTGLTTPFHIFEINRIESKSDHSICFFENFGQYKAISFDVGVHVCSLVIPKRTEITIDISYMRKLFEAV
jgi:phosphopantetheinyl transferase